jgi:hypothetical protein
MSGTLARRVPTNGMGGGPDRHAAPALRLGTCRAFVAPTSDGAQDQASAQQDPDIARTAPVARLLPMPASLPHAVLRWLRAAARSLTERFRGPADPSLSSPATGRSAMRLPFAVPRAGFREFTLPRHLADGGALRLRVKSAGVSTRIGSLPRRGTP